MSHKNNSLGASYIRKLACCNHNEVDHNLLRESRNKL